MSRLLGVVSIATLVLVNCATSAPSGWGSSEHGSVGIGHVAGGRFGGIGSFSSGRVVYSPFNVNAAGLSGSGSGVNDLITSSYVRQSSSQSSSSDSYESGGTSRYIRRWKVTSG